MMTGSELLEMIERLPIPTEKSAPLTTKLEQHLDVGPGRGRATYNDQKHHWTRWLTEYQPSDRPAVKIYNSINCPTMLFWLAEALGKDRVKLRVAYNAALTAAVNQPAQSAAIRRSMPWSEIRAGIIPKYL